MHPVYAPGRSVVRLPDTAGVAGRPRRRRCSALDRRRGCVFARDVSSDAGYTGSIPARDDVPSTLERSAKHAQDLYTAARASANAEYGPGERAERTAWAAVKHEYEKVGDHWEAKEQSGPSDSGAAGSRGSGRTRGGVDANASKAHLMDVAKRLDVRGRSRMTKDELVDAIGKANDRATAKARD